MDGGPVAREFHHRLGEEGYLMPGWPRDWGMLMARTDPTAPKHRGISFILMERDAPGVTVRPLADLSDGYVVTETFFENARVPRRNLVGEENRGWYVAMSAMNLERSGIS